MKSKNVLMFEDKWFKPKAIPKILIGQTNKLPQSAIKRARGHWYIWTKEHLIWF